MKLAVICETTLDRGGGFNQALNAAVQIERLAGEFIEYFVVRDEQTGEVLSEHTKAEVKKFKPGLLDGVVKIGQRFDAAGDVSRLTFLSTKLERMLIKDGIDLVYFLAPSSTPLLLRNLNYVLTVWDICHRDSPEFPEVRNNGESKWRDYSLQNTLSKAVLTLVDSTELRDRLQAQFGVSADRLLPMPFSAAPHLQNTRPLPRPEDGYLYYPAQFWAHKNHVRILEALKILAEDGLRPNVVFSGGDKGCLDHIKALSSRFGLDQQVKIAGFVQPEEMVGLFEGAAAVLMPSYFGPTNLPPLEAWKMRRPLICSTVMSKQVGDAAITFDPDRADDLAQAIRDVLQKNIADQLVERGSTRLEELEAQRMQAETDFVAKLESYGAKRRCWP